MPEAFAVGGVLVRTLPAVAIIAAIVAIWTSGWLAKRGGVDGKQVRRLAEAAIWSGFLAARAAYVMANWEAYRNAPWTALYLWQPGYSLVSGMVAAVVYLAWRLAAGPRAGRGPRTLALLGGHTAGAALVGAVAFAVFGAPPAGSIATGQRVGDFRLVDLTAHPVKFSELSGRPVVLNFWATWCAPCRREMPLLDRLQRTRAADGLVVVGIDVDEPVARVREFVDSLSINYPIWLAPPPGTPGFDSTRAVYERTASIGLPTTLFVDRKGIVRFKYLGELTPALIKEQVDKLLAR